MTNPNLKDALVSTNEEAQTEGAMEQLKEGDLEEIAGGRMVDVDSDCGIMCGTF